MPRGMPSIGDPLMRVSPDVRTDARIPLDDIGREVQQYATPLALEVARVTERVTTLEALTQAFSSGLREHTESLVLSIATIPPPMPATTILTPLREFDLPALHSNLNELRRFLVSMSGSLDATHQEAMTRLSIIESTMRDNTTTLLNIRDTCSYLAECERARALVPPSVWTRIYRWLGGD